MRVSSSLPGLIALMHPQTFEQLSAAPGQELRTWTFEPGVVAPLAVLMVAYAVGVARVWRSAGVGAGIRVWQVGAFVAGCTALVAALVSPVDAISDTLSSAHMVQHELLMMVAAPLLVAALPVLGVLFAMPIRLRRWVAAWTRLRAVSALWTALTAPALVWLLHGAAIWLWHIPALYDAALEDARVHALEHASFFVTAMLFWWGMTRGRYGRMGYGAAVVYVFGTALHTGLLGAALTLSPSVWYPYYSASTAAWGLTPLEDQQLAGLIMWVPAGLLFTAIGLLFFAAWVRESERRSRFASVACAVLAVMVVAGSMSGCQQGSVQREAAAMTGGDPERGAQAITKYGCDTCHTIPGVTRARGHVGPSLEGVANRVYLAGHVPNTPLNMQDWIQHPHAHDVQTVMPETGITAQDARDVAAYLYTLR